MSAKVLETYELLEDILLRLPLRQILLIQRVNKTFYAVIQDSDRIKRALFLEPTSTAFAVRDRKFTPGTPDLHTTHPDWKSSAITSRSGSRRELRRLLSLLSIRLRSCKWFHEQLQTPS